MSNKKQIASRLRLPAALAIGVVIGSSMPSASAWLTQTMGGDSAYKSPGSELRIEMLLDREILGGDEVEVGIITFPAGTNSGDHKHGATEIFYVLSGELQHVVNGTNHRLAPGDIGFVRPPDAVNHIVSEQAGETKAIVIWAPGGEGTRIVERWQAQ